LRDLCLTITELNEYVNGLFSKDPMLRGLNVRGEVSGFKRHSSGHLYFNLKDENAVLRCVMFRQNAQFLSFPMRDGISVVCEGSVKLYVQGGQYQLYVQSIAQEGDGELYRRFALMKTRLEAQGLFDSARKKPLPLLPKCLGVVTSASGAAIQDILQITKRRFPAMHVQLHPVRVQGEGAAEEIAAAIRRLNSLNTVDVMIVGRGGGSIEDLWAFNEEVVARAIYESEIPVVSAVGHETDFSISDFVADLRAPTPSAAAELCVPEYTALAEQIESRREKSRSILENNLRIKRQNLEALRISAGFAQPGFLMQNLRRDLEKRQEALLQNTRALLREKRHKQNALLERLRALSPLEVLDRGYAMLQDEDGKYLMKIGDTAEGQAARIRMADGSAKIRIERKEI